MAAEVSWRWQFGQLRHHLISSAGGTGAEAVAERAADQLHRAILDEGVHLRVEDLGQEVNHLVRVQVR